MISGARGETRTPTLFPELDPKSSASTNSATLAYKQSFQVMVLSLDNMFEYIKVHEKAKP